MNPTIIRLVISLVLAVAVFFAVELTTGLPADQAQIASFAAILIGLLIAAFANPSSSPSGSSSHSDASEETGTVKWFNVKKGYGFITRDSGDDVFVHYRNLNSSGSNSGRRGISDGQRVKFIVIDGDKGLQADEVEAI